MCDSAVSWTSCLFHEAQFYLKEWLKDKWLLFRLEYLAKRKQLTVLAEDDKNLNFHGKFKFWKTYVLSESWQHPNTQRFFRNEWKFVCMCVVCMRVYLHACVCILILYNEMCNYLEDPQLSNVFQMINESYYVSICE